MKAFELLYLGLVLAATRKCSKTAGLKMCLAMRGGGNRSGNKTEEDARNEGFEEDAHGRRSTFSNRRIHPVFGSALTGLEPFLPALHRQVRKHLLQITASYPSEPRLLDVGGRKSHYTIGLTAAITITDLPRKSQVQEQLHLGLTAAMIQQLKARRSNVAQVLFDDMTRSTLADESFDCVVAVEVLEHVDEDARFVSEVLRVLRPGGAFLMTTPNGDHVQNRNPDHKRHYTREQLRSLLVRFFTKVEVWYAILDSRCYRWSLTSWSVKHPVTTLRSMWGSFLSFRESTAVELGDRADKTQKLMALASKE
jgi:SAM-dependent methyltransferase